MNTQSYQVLSELKSLLKQGKSAFLVTVLETWGASPRPAGSVLVFDPHQNRVFGSVSGGCVEEDLLSSLLDTSTLQSQQFPEIRRFGLDASGYALPCGAEISLLVERFDASDARSNCSTSSMHINDLISGLDEGKVLRRSVDLATGQLTIKSLGNDETGFTRVCYEDDIASVSFGSPDRLLIIGATDVAAALLPLAEQIGYQVEVCEPRTQQLERQTNIASCYIRSDVLPDDLIKASFQDSSCAVVALAHDPRIDDLGLIAALDGRAHFVGALGSQRNADMRYQRLLSVGVSKRALERLHAPIGLSIGSRTPFEIAVSITAQLVEQRSGSTSWSWSPAKVCTISN